MTRQDLDVHRVGVIPKRDEYLQRLEEIEQADLSADERLIARLMAATDQAIVEALTEYGSIVEALKHLGFVRSAGLLERDGGGNAES